MGEKIALYACYMFLCIALPSAASSTGFLKILNQSMSYRKHGFRLNKEYIYYSGRKAARVKVSVALSNSFFLLGSRWAER